MKRIAFAVLAAAALVSSTVVVERAITPDQHESTALANAVDRQRREDLQAVAMTLQTFVGEHGVYPPSGSPGHGKGAQPLSALYRLDDPTGEHYWYESNGQFFVLYARRDGDEVPACPEQPKHPVPGIGSVMCWIGP